MHIPPFLLDHWLNAHELASTPVRYNLAASIGPVWTIAELLALAGHQSLDSYLGDVVLSYALPQGSIALRQRLADLHNVDPDWIVVTTGASEALSALFCIAAEPGANVILPSPVFPAIAAMARLWGLEVKSYVLSPHNGFAHDADQILAVVDKQTKLVLINTPHNPTGAVMPYVQLTRLAERLAERGVPLVVDEVYHPLYFGTPVPTAARLPNTLVVGDFSKAFSLSGLRIGWIVDADSVRRQQLIDARSYFTISGSPVTEALAVLALDVAPTILTRLQAVAEENLIHLDAFMHKYTAVIAWVRPSGGTTAFPWLVDGGNTRRFCERLAQRGVLMVPGDCFDAPHHFRIGFGTQANGFADALGLASEVLESA